MVWKIVSKTEERKRWQRRCKGRREERNITPTNPTCQLCRNNWRRFHQPFLMALFWDASTYLIQTEPIANDGRFEFKSFSELIVFYACFHADIINAIHNLVKTGAYTISWNHVKGHQDQAITMVLIRDAWLNIGADQFAPNAVQAIAPGPIWYNIPHSSWVCYLDNMHLVRKQFKTQLRTYVTSPKVVEYWWLCQ